MVRLMFKRLLLVQLVVSSVAVLGSTVDSLIVARMLGTDAIAACGLLNPFVILTAAISAIISSGTQMVCSKSAGAGKAEKANRQLGIAFAASTAIAAAIVILGYLFIDQFCLLMGVDPETQLFSDTKAYACGLLASLLPSVPSALTMFACVSNGDMARCRIGGIAIVSLNVVFSIASIAIFNGGLFGVGLATTLSSYLTFFYLLGHFRSKNASLRPSFSGMAWEDFKQILLIGSPRAAYKICTFLLIFFFNSLLLEYYSHEYVAAYSVVRNIYGIVSFATGTLVYCTTLITSTFFGEENRRALHDTVKEFTRLSLIMGIVGFLLIFAFGRFITLLYLDPGTSIYETTCVGLVIIASSLPFCSIAACLQTFFIGTGHQGWGIALNIIAALILTPAAGFLFMPMLDALFVYAAIPAGYILELIAIGAFVAMRKHQSPLHASSYLFVPEDFGVPNEHELSFEVRKPDDLTQCKPQYERFCQSVGCSDVENQSFEALSLFANSCMKRKESRNEEACYARAYYKENALNLIIWNTFGLLGSNPISRILARGKAPHRNSGLLGAERRGADTRRNEAAPKAQRRSGNRTAHLDAELAKLLEGCEYSLGNPYGLEKLRVAFEHPKDAAAQGEFPR